MNVYFGSYQQRRDSNAAGNDVGLLVLDGQRVCTFMMQKEAPVFEPKGSNLYHH